MSDARQDWIGRNHDLYRFWLDTSDQRIADWRVGYAVKQEEQIARGGVDAVLRARLFSTSRLPSLPFLQGLYDTVLAHSERRMPRWKLTPMHDLAMEVQPKLTRVGRLFEFQAVQSPGVTPDVFMQRASDWPKAWVKVKGTLAEAPSDSAAAWFTVTRWQATRNRGDVAHLAELRDTVLDVFTDPRFSGFQATKMFSGHCLICGKCLTDPVSMARHIGPECAGTSSPHIRWLIDLAEAA